MEPTRPAGTRPLATGKPLPEDLRTRLAALVDRVGETPVVKMGISRMTLSRAIGGLGLRRGSHLVIREVLAAAEAGGRAR